MVVSSHTWNLVATGVSLGLLHVLAGPDHLSALAALAVGTSYKAFMLGVRWGLGHSTGLIVVAIIFIALKGDLDLRKLGRYCDFLVGIFMIGLGSYGVITAIRLYREKKKKRDPDYWQSTQSLLTSTGLPANGSGSNSGSSTSSNSANASSVSSANSSPGISTHTVGSGKLTHTHSSHHSHSHSNNYHQSQHLITDLDDETRHGGDMELVIPMESSTSLGLSAVKKSSSIQDLSGTVVPRKSIAAVTVEPTKISTILDDLEDALMLNHDHDHHEVYVEECPWCPFIDMHDPNTQRIISFSIGLLHGVAGPGGILGVLPAVEMQRWTSSVLYLGSFIITSTLSMGVFAALYGEITKRLGATTESMELYLSVFSSAMSIIVGTIWFVLSMLGKLDEFFD